MIIPRLVLPANFPVYSRGSFRYGEAPQQDFACGVMDHAPGPDAMWRIYADRLASKAAGKKTVSFSYTE